ncbi:TOMM precursor leader peptide-binding protein [Delftia tsuruhatensis]|nr:TOMM precursor leader peptide-binding protein [Delftia tsuruhatensis]MDH0773142.1 TOMM precursor leader peptide-binding protein [Delftia tsuruhatensis]MDH1457632.1 TOMM precursor leader peptide-binding protein [Delftia tsuruhatensis]MDH1823957.1 TOMM precursor leader peptide-binding protein [Delftia tsuruhatensis]WGG13397.1 TOMM precursor leader peptide-binding protein [Delftia tsuruhatensis]
MPEPAAPDLFADAFRWHEKFLPPVQQGDRLLLASERDTLALGSAAVLALNAPLQAGTSLMQHCATAPDAPLAQMLHALGALLRQGLVQPVLHSDLNGHGYLQPDFSAPPVHLQASEQIDIVLLTAALDSTAACHWAAAVATQAPAPLTIVFCDDYLDPRLGAIDAGQRAAGRPWLLVRPAGEQAMAGPLFTPHAGTASACWHCLAHRWQRNHPARAAQGGPPHDSGRCPPVRAGADLIATRLQALLPTVQRLLAHTDAAQTVWTLEPLQAHPVAARPQCPHCGTPGLMALRQREPIAPVPGTHAARADGGWRSVPAETTVQRLSRHVSPLTGVIARVTPLTAETDEALTVYRSEIFRTPAPGSGFLAGPPTQLCLGKGLSAMQARASAMCEAVERYAAFHQGDEAVVVAPAAQLDAPCIPPTALARFSDRQTARFANDRPPHAVAPGAGQGEPLWWAPAWSLTADARRYLPLGFCLAHAPAQSQHHVGWTSNGCAAGNTREEAILQGFMELVERDAAAIWWYGQIRRPAIALDGIAAATRQRLARSCGPQWSYWLLDITHDFGIPVVVCVGHHADTGHWAVGFGCSLDRALACERALTEISQLIAAGKGFAVPQQVQAFLHPLDGTDAPPQQPAQQADTAPPDIAQAIAHCVDIARGLGLETIVYDHSRPDIPLYTVKVVVPGLCHIWPELGNPRLRDVPVALGWRSRPLQESEFNPQALYV